MVQLRILGSAEIRKTDRKLEHSFLAGAKRLALLTYLVLNQSKGFLRRDQLLPLFWPHQGQKSARNSLSNMLYHIRKSLGSTLLVTRGTEELKLEVDSIWCDAVAFEQALDEGKPGRAIEFYSGNLLEGFHASNISPQMEQWLDHERERIRSGFLDALETLAILEEENGQFDEAAKLWKKRAFEDPFDTRIAKKLAISLAASGQHTEAIRRAKEHSRFLEKELDIEYSDTLPKLIDGLEEVRPKAIYLKKEIKFNDNDYAGSVAVLPFEELGTHSEISNFATGLHHDLLTRLSGVAMLKVISRTSVLHYKHSGKSIRQIAKELGVDTVVEGAIQQSGEQLRLHVQVIEAKSDGHKVAETYDRKLTSKNLFSLQSELAKKITSSLQTYLSPKEKERISEWTPTEIMEAYRYYVMGRRELDQRTEKAMRSSLEFFNRAVELDQEYALAWVGIADALILLFDYGHESSENTLREASVAIKKALNLDPNLAEAHASMGLLHSNWHEGPDAIRELLIATELQPNYAEAHNWLSWNYQLLGKAENALKSARKAVELNPLSPEAVSNLSVSYLYNGHLDDALLEAQKAIDLQPEWPTPQFYKSLALYHIGRHDEAYSVLKNLTVPWAGAGPLATAALCEALSGNVKKAREMQDHFKKAGHFFAAGLIHASFGEYDEAIGCFLKVERWDDWPTLAMYHLYPVELNSIWDGEKFQEILKIVRKSRGQIPSPVKAAITTSNKKSIAVLPFKNLGANKQSSHFTAGFQYDLIAILSRISGLTVISGDSMKAFEKSEGLLSDLSQKLDVGTVIKGGVQQVNKRLRLNIQCIELENESIRWAETYDRKLSAENLFDIQTELAQKIARNLRKTLTGKEKELFRTPPTENLNAYLLYVQGRTHLAQRTEYAVVKAYDFFRRAMDVDPHYELALSGYVEAIALSRLYGYTISDKKMADPFTVAKKATDINPLLGEVHASLGILYSQQQNAPAAIREFKTAIKLRPGYADAHIWLGWIKMISGSPQEAIKPSERATELNPLAPFTHAFLAEVYLAVGMYTQSLKESKVARELQPDYGVAHLMEGLSLFHLKRYSEAAFVLKQTLGLVEEKGYPRSSGVKAILAVTQIINGELREAKVQLSKVNDPFAAGLIYAALGNVDKTFRQFEKIKRWGPFSTPIIRYHFPKILDRIRKDSRFDKILQQVKKSWLFDMS